MRFAASATRASSASRRRDRRHIERTAARATARAAPGSAVRKSARQRRHATAQVARRPIRRNRARDGGLAPARCSRDAHRAVRCRGRSCRRSAQGALAVETLAGNDDSRRNCTLPSTTNRRSGASKPNAPRCAPCAPGAARRSACTRSSIGASMTIDAAFATAGGVDASRAASRAAVDSLADAAQARRAGRRTRSPPLAIAWTTARAAAPHAGPPQPHRRRAARPRGRSARTARRRNRHRSDEHDPADAALPVQRLGRGCTSLPRLAARPSGASAGRRDGAAVRRGGRAAGFAPDIVAPEASIDAFVAAVAQRLEAP